MKEKIQAYWNHRAGTYSEMIREDLNSFKKEAWKKLIQDTAAGKKKIKVLEIGTGPGFFAIIMGEMGYDVTAVDCSDAMIQEAKANTAVAGVKVNFIKSNGEQLDLPKESFDLIISRNVTWTIKEPEKTYESWFHLLKKDGKLVIFDANWYLRLAKPEMQEEYENNMILAESMGYSCKTNAQQRAACEWLARELPLTYKQRPQWDEEILTQCGFKTVTIEKDISEIIYTEEEKMAYKTTPMFSICACKV